MDTDLKILLGVILFTAALTILIGLCSCLSNYYILHNYDVRVEEVSTGKIIYEGRSACVRTQSRGQATQVKVMSPFLWCSVFPSYEFLGTVKIETLK